MCLHGFQRLIDGQQRSAVGAAVFAQSKLPAFAFAPRGDEWTSRGQRAIAVRAGVLGIVRDGTERGFARAACPMSVLSHDARTTRVCLNVAARGPCHRGLVGLADAAMP